MRGTAKCINASVVDRCTAAAMRVLPRVCVTVESECQGVLPLFFIWTPASAVLAVSHVVQLRQSLALVTSGAVALRLQNIGAFSSSSNCAFHSIQLPSSSRAYAAFTNSSSASGTITQPSPLSVLPASAGPAQEAADTNSTAAAAAKPPNRKARRAALRKAVAEAGRRASRYPPEGVKSYKARLEARQQARQLGSLASIAAASPAKLNTAAPPVLEGKCRRKNVQLGWKKIDFVLRMIRRSYVDDAMAQLAVNPKKAAVFVLHAVANARNNAICAGATASKLWISEAYVTKGEYIHRPEFMSRGYTGIKTSRKSHLNVTVRQVDESDPAVVARLRRSARLIAPLNIRQQWSRDEGRSRLRLWSGRGLQQQQQQLGVRA